MESNRNNLHKLNKYLFKEISSYLYFNEMINFIYLNKFTKAFFDYTVGYLEIIKYFNLIIKDIKISLSDLFSFLNKSNTLEKILTDYKYSMEDLVFIFSSFLTQTNIHKHLSEAQLNVEFENNKIFNELINELIKIKEFSRHINLNLKNLSLSLSKNKLINLSVDSFYGMQDSEFLKTRHNFGSFTLNLGKFIKISDDTILDYFENNQNCVKYFKLMLNKLTHPKFYNIFRFNSESIETVHIENIFSFEYLITNLSSINNLKKVSIKFEQSIPFNNFSTILNFLFDPQFNFDVNLTFSKRLFSSINSVGKMDNGKFINLTYERCKSLNVYQNIVCKLEFLLLKSFSSCEELYIRLCFEESEIHNVSYQDFKEVLDSFIYLRKLHMKLSSSNGKIVNDFLLNAYLPIMTEFSLTIKNNFNNSLSTFISNNFHIKKMTVENLINNFYLHIDEDIIEFHSDSNEDYLILNFIIFNMDFNLNSNNNKTLKLSGSIFTEMLNYSFNNNKLDIMLYYLNFFKSLVFYSELGMCEYFGNYSEKDLNKLISLLGQKVETLVLKLGSYQEIFLFDLFSIKFENLKNIKFINDDFENPIERISLLFKNIKKAETIGINNYKEHDVMLNYNNFARVKMIILNEFEIKDYHYLPFIRKSKINAKN